MITILGVTGSNSTGPWNVWDTTGGGDVGLARPLTTTAATANAQPAMARMWVALARSTRRTMLPNRMARD